VLSFASLQSISKASCSILYIDIAFHKQTVKNPFSSQQIDKKSYLNSSLVEMESLNGFLLRGRASCSQGGFEWFLDDRQSLNGLLLRGRAACSQRKVWMVSC